jgi:hypothetical protein
MLATEFGFYPVRYNVSSPTFEIATLDDFDEQVKLVMDGPTVERDWIYAPPREQISLGIPGTRILPYASRVFGLPKTHRLMHSYDDPKRSAFLIWVFGFLVGMKLSESEKGHLDAAPLRPGTSNDVVWCGDSLGRALSKADQFFDRHAHEPKIERAMRAVIHSYLLADLPTLLDFEQFLHLYTAVDAAYAAYGHINGAPSKRVFHSERIAYLCEQLRISLPWWAEKASPYVAERRNETIHEGLFLGEPWGFATFGDEKNRDSKQRMILLELQKLMSRIVMALLDVRDETYLQSKVDDRQRHGIHLS